MIAGLGLGAGSLATNTQQLRSSLPRPRSQLQIVQCDAGRYTVSKDGTVCISDPRFERVDQKLFSDPKYRKFVKDHAIHDTLAGPGKVEQYEMYVNKETEELLSVITIGKSLNGYPNIVHGGILGLLIDNSFGLLFLNLNKPYSVTANLNINYRNPTYAGTQVVLHAKIDKVEGRKLFMTASVEDVKTRKVLVESSTLFLTMRRAWWDPFGVVPKANMLLADLGIKLP